MSNTKVPTALVEAARGRWAALARDIEAVRRNVKDTEGELDDLRTRLATHERNAVELGAWLDANDNAVRVAIDGLPEVA
jgi:predicted  nucleic acid-binding Zn-ribbon protein